MKAPRAVTLGALALVAALVGCGTARPWPEDAATPCDRCHLQPPASGAHLAHVAGGALRAGLACTECHPAVTSVTFAGHANSPTNLAWSALAGPATRFADGRCSGSYCHGGKRGGTNPQPSWTGGPQEGECGTCHWAASDAPPYGHPTLDLTGAQIASLGQCNACHAETVKADGTIDVEGGRHVDGSMEVYAPCGACHGLPPASGAHLRHATLGVAVPNYGDLRIFEEIDPASSSTDYAFGCGHCHPLDPARHMDGMLQVELDNPEAPPGIKARNLPGASYDPATGRCGGVYCHSTGQRSPKPDHFKETPPWDAAPGRLGCDGCHGNPPAYPNGGIGADTANGHLPVGWMGHFGTVFGHGNDHGNPYVYVAGEINGLARGAAFTCQICHYESVDPRNTGPSGFYWLDVTTDVGWKAEWKCTYCHTTAEGSPGWRVGRAWPLRHVNGRLDVVFDPRRTLPESAKAIFDGKRYRPVAPYWFWRDGAQPLPGGPDLGNDYPVGTTWTHVANAVYDPITRTCSTVSCHLRQPDWSWGQVVGGERCGSRCHNQ